MNVIKQLRNIVNNQKTVRTSRLRPMVFSLELQQKQMLEKFEGQRKAVNAMNRRYQMERDKANKRLKRIEDLEKAGR